MSRRARFQTLRRVAVGSELMVRGVDLAFKFCTVDLCGPLGGGGGS